MAFKLRSPAFGPGRAIPLTIAATVRALPKGVPQQDAGAGVGSQGLNDFAAVGYSGPRRSQERPICTSSGCTLWTSPSYCHRAGAERTS